MSVTWGSAHRQENAATESEGSGSPLTHWLRGLVILATIWSWILNVLRFRSLKGKRALVSKAGGNLGRELSVELAKQGCKVICVDQDPLLVQNTLREVEMAPLSVPLHQREEEGRARGYACDWRNSGEALGLARAVADDEGGLDILFVISQIDNSFDGTVDAISRVTKAEIWPVLGFLPGMLARSQGHVVHVIEGAGAETVRAADRSDLVAEAWTDSLQEMDADVRYTRVRLERAKNCRQQQTRMYAAKIADVARSIVWAVRQDFRELRLCY